MNYSVNALPLFADQTGAGSPPCPGFSLFEAVDVEKWGKVRVILVKSSLENAS
jgi:hypothetical protein